MAGLAPKPGVFEISPYVGTRAEAPQRVHQLSANESAIGPSSAALAAYREAAVEIAFYPDGGAETLRQAIGALHGLDVRRIVCGNGSDELLSLLGLAYVRPGDEVVFSEHAFLVYRIIALANSAFPVVVPEPDLRVDVDRVLAAVSPRTRIVFIANPNNPTGTFIGRDELHRLHAGLPSGVLLVIDAAYAEFVRRADYESGIELVSRFENVVMTRTFSKAYALAGLRVGWAFCPASVAAVLHRVRGPYNVSIAAQRAAAAALRDRAHLEKAVAHNERWRGWIVDEIRKLGLRADDSEGNFVLVHFRDPEMAAAADKYLIAGGVIVRPVANYGLPQCLRITVGLEQANRAALAILTDFVKANA